MITLNEYVTLSHYFIYIVWLMVSDLLLVQRLAPINPGRECGRSSEP